MLDAGALIAFERGDRKVRHLVELARSRHVRVHVPAGVVAQVWRGGAGQARLARLLRAPEVDVDPLDLVHAQAVGSICALASTTDVVDASVVLAARRHHAPVVTSDPGDIAAIDPTLVVHAC